MTAKVRKEWRGIAAGLGVTSASPLA